ncbi:Cyclic di-GMP phosphodiesterase [bioreactor metagenome]|uniref:Cyclic di-GMP phosphodiesterase n=1 Tax=bioreactor metagenome TaxID=1076179 RepID=A0A644YN56_9ZZZZ
MIYIPVGHLKDGMILAQNVNTEVGGNPLLAKGQVLKEIYINRLKYFNITGVYIESSFSNDVEMIPMIDEKLKTEALLQLKSTFNDLANTGKLMVSTIQSLKDIAYRLVDSILSNEEVLINLIDLKGYDDYTYQHSLCVTIIAVSLGNKMDLNKSILKQLALSGLLHDLGKMSVPKTILNKPGKLTDEEFEIIKQHPETAVKLLEKTRLISTMALQGIQSHHERFDGNGYSRGLSGDNIPLFGRILAVADVYDALTSNRPYRKAGLPNEVIEYMMGNAYIHFDYEVLKAFLKSVVAYPAGMLVTLSDGKKAMIVKNNEENTLRPIVRLINNNETEYTDIDLLHNEEYWNITIVGMGYDDDSTDFCSVSDM